MNPCSAGSSATPTPGILTAGEERVLKGLAVQPNRPWNTNVREMYEMFVCGELDVWGRKQENCSTLRNAPGKRTANRGFRARAPSLSFLNRPDIKAFVDRWLKPSVDYYHEIMPHVHRHRGQYSLSQITMDDVDLPFRMKGDEKVHAYYAYDSVSECVIAASYGRKKDEALVDECFREMFRLIKRRRWGMLT